MRFLVLPGGLLAAVAAALVQSGFAKGFAPAVDFCYYTAFAAGLILSWRFHSTRIFSALILLLLAQHSVEFFSHEGDPFAGPGLIAFQAVSFLLPLNFALLVLARERGFGLSTAIPRLALLFVESVFVAVLCRPGAGSDLFGAVLVRRDWFAWTRIPQISLLVFVIVATGVLIRAFTKRKAVDSGFFWALFTFFLAFHSGGGVGVGARAYIATAAVILMVSIIETSYAMAYHDELTGLPSRRAFNDETARLQPPYVVAVVDVDHFKSVNDTYGHETGDEVLCMVAANLAHVTGGGHAFRVGGEEFSILFVGKTVREVIDDLEALRAQIEQSTFKLRGADRRRTPRGPDRRSSTAPRKRARPRTKSTLPTPSGELRVTASIGAAEPTPKHPDLEDVIELADQALYSAKRAGRNRVEIATGTRRREKKKTGQRLA